MFSESQAALSSRSYPCPGPCQLSIRRAVPTHGPAPLLHPLRLITCPWVSPGGFPGSNRTARPKSASTAVRSLFSNTFLLLKSLWRQGDRDKDGHQGPTYLLLASRLGSQDTEADALSPQSRPSYLIWGAGSAPGWIPVGWANSTPVPAISKAALTFSERLKASILAWEATCLRKIYNIWDVHEHRSLNKLACVSVQAPRGSSPPRRLGESGVQACALSSTSY